MLDEQKEQCHPGNHIWNSSWIRKEESGDSWLIRAQLVPYKAFGTEARVEGLPLLGFISCTQSLVGCLHP